MGPATNPVGISSVPGVSPDEDKSKILDQDLKKKELEFKQKQLQWIQQEIGALQQQLTAQTNPATQPAGSNMQELDRLEEQEQENLAQQQSVNMQNQVMQQTQQSTQQMNQMQQNMQRQTQASRWIMPERTNIKIALSNTELECDVAATPRQQASGLQAYRNLPTNRGLWFPFTARRTATFHMGDVKFPIDIIFIDNNKISKIVVNVQPRQLGSWSSICTDVLEVNGGWCVDNRVSVGDIVQTPLIGKKRAVSDVERLVNKSWSAPQDARITGAATSFDTLRTITTAEGGDESVFSPEEEADILNTFPFLKSAQMSPDFIDDIHVIDRGSGVYILGADGYIDLPDSYEEGETRSVRGTAQYDGQTWTAWSNDEGSRAIADRLNQEGWSLSLSADAVNIGTEYASWYKSGSKTAQEHRQPDTTDKRSPGTKDLRNPADRFEHNTLPDELDPFGDGGSNDVDPFANPNAPNGRDEQSGYGKHFKLQVGYDPTIFREEDLPQAIRPSAQIVKVNAPGSETELAGLDKFKLASGSVKLFDTHGPNWQNYDVDNTEENGRNYDKIAIVNDQVISGWIDSLGFNGDNEAKLRQSMFTDEYKKLLGDALISSGKIVDYEIFDSDLLLYQ